MIRVTVDLKSLEAEPHAPKGLIDAFLAAEVAKELAAFRSSSDKKAQDFVAAAHAAGECTRVYNGCGSCTSCGKELCARVDFYCGSGGSEPDFSICEVC